MHIAIERLNIHYRPVVLLLGKRITDTRNTNQFTLSQDNGAAYEAGGLEVGQLILEVDGHKVEGNFIFQIFFFFLSLIQLQT